MTRYRRHRSNHYRNQKMFDPISFLPIAKTLAETIIAVGWIIIFTKPLIELVRGKKDDAF